MTPALHPPILLLSLHGTAHVQCGSLTMPLRGRAAALVALAALEPGISRERTAAWLWPDAPNARQNLRQQLLRFRQTLGTALVAGDDRLQLAPGVQLVSPGAGEELLADEDVSDDAFGVWLKQQRDAQRQARRQPLLQALSAAEQAGDLDSALAHANALLAQEPGEESHHASLMRVHYLRGETAAGLAVHERLVHTLQSLYNTEPAPATLQLAAALTRGRPATPQQPASALPVLLRRPPLLAGRSTELAAVQQAWSDGQAALIEGEAGLGKSRLITELTAGDAAAWVVSGRPGDSGAPYATLARLIARLLAPRLSLAASLGSALQASTQRTLSRVALTASEDPAASPLPPGAMAAAVAELLQQAGARTVVVDDLHFADAATTELVAGLASAPDAPQRWLFAQRPAEAPAAAQNLRDALGELRRLAVVKLQPLDGGAAALLVESLAIPGLQGAGLAEALVRHTGGNPLFVLETLKQGLADGSLARGELPRPSSVGALIERRLQRLSEPALTLARVAAVAGVDFTIELAEAAIGVRAVQLASAWDELQTAHVLRDEAFAHDLVADAVLRGVPVVVARRVHGQCAAWLAAHGGEPARVARHWRAAGQSKGAAMAFEQAAKRAREAARPTEEAELHLQAAQAYADAGMTEARFDALANRVSALIGAQSDAAALAEARALPDQAHTDTQRVHALRVLTDQLGQRGPFEDAIDVGQQGMALARRVGAQNELVRLTSLTAGNQIKIGRTQEAYSLMLPLRDWVDREADDELRQIWYGYWAAVLGHTGRLREGVASYDVAIACAERSGARAFVSMALLNQCVVLRTMGALQRATDASRRGLALLPADADSANHRLARLMHARNEAESGHFGTALSTLEELLPHFEAMEAPFWVHAVRTTQARLWQHLGQHARALQALQGLQSDSAGVPAWMQAGQLWIRLEVEQWLGLPVAAGPSQQALALLDGDANRRTGNAIRGLRFAPPSAVLQQAAALADSARSLELFGALAALQMQRARAALALQQHGEAASAAHALVGLLREGYVPDFAYTPEAWLLAAQALRAAGEAKAAHAALSAGQHWVRTQALPEVPAPFIDSFLHRNPVNRELLALGAWTAEGVEAKRAKTEDR